MDTRNLFDARRHMRGAAKFTAVTVIAVFAVLGVAAWFLIIEPHMELVMSDNGGHPSTPVSAATPVAPPPPADVGAMDVDQLLSEARKAMTAQRYLAPAGNNAFEFYLKVLQKQPGNRVATDALRETFPFAANSAEQAINTRDFNEAQRQINLLAQADPTNFTLTILRSKLDAQRKLLDKQQQQTLDQQKAQQLAAAKAAAEKQAADKLAEQQKAQLAEQQKAKPTATPSRKASATSEGATASTANSAGAEQSTEAVLVSGAAPRYPREALRARQSGWVVVAFTIEPNGRTSHITVVSAEPHRVFDRAAMDAVNRYHFKPATKNGVAVASQRQQKIEFNL
ncbi:MAG: energy transducer TonB [Xanthomonadaceae bacterium]|nr:energy transducer TonB [Xanthomonadaceae bacterium]MDE3072629.1 energy transducer TonB [Pseudomonadota bacterium]